MKIFSNIIAVFLLLGSMALLAQTEPNPLENFENFSETRAFLRQAEECLNEGDYKGAAKNYKKAAKLQATDEKKAEYLYLEAQNLLQAKKIHDALRAYDYLLREHVYQIPLENVLEQLRELAGDFEQGDGTFLGIKDPQAAIDIYKLIIQYEEAIQQSLDDRLVLAGKLEADEQFEEAVNVYQDIIKLLPDDPNTRFGLAKVLAKIAADGDGDGTRSKAAVREARRFLEVSDKNDPRRNEAEAIIQTARNHEGDRLLERAEFYLNKHHYKPEVARRYLVDLRREYDGTTAAQKAQELLDQHFPGTGAAPATQEAQGNAEAE